MTLTIVGAALLVLSGLAVVGGLVPLDVLADQCARITPVLGFVVAISIVSALTARAGVFDVVAAALGRWARGRTVALWLAVVSLAIVCTAFLSLDTTAVLLTPVVIVLARANGLPALPFAFTTVWLANTASLLLPVSNLTNLLAEQRMDRGGPAAFLMLLGPSAVIAIAVTTALVFILHRSDLRGRYVPAAVAIPEDRRLTLLAGVLVALLLPALVSGVAPWIPASLCATTLVALFLWRAPRALSARDIPWAVLIFAAGLLLAVAAAQTLGAAALTGALTGSGDSLADLLRVAGAGAVSANAIDNLPAYVLLESGAQEPARLAALLIGVNAGPVITPWASLATLLWYRQLRIAGLDVTWWSYARRGTILALLVVPLAVLPLAV